MCFRCLFSVVYWLVFMFFLFKQKTAYEMRISDWSSDVFFRSELIDSRYPNYGFDLASVIADTTSAAAFMTGEHGITPAGLDVKTLVVVILRNGEVAATAAGAAVLGRSLNSVALLANSLTIGRASCRSRKGQTVEV